MAAAPRKPRLAVWKFASCDGCQLSLLDCEDELLAVAGAVDVAYFPEATRGAVKGRYDLSLVEGSITTPDDAERIQDVRRRSRTLVTIGACATAGGIQALRNFADVGAYTAIVYARPDYIRTLATSTPIADHVRVDFELRGCPISKSQLLEVITAMLAGRRPARLKLNGKGQLDSLNQGTDVMIWYRQGNDNTLLADSISPSGLWGIFIATIIKWHNSVSGFSALAGGVVLGLMMIPLVMRTTEEVLQLVPGGYREAALALGIAKWKTVVQIVIRTALKGIVTGVMLALARVAGETAPLLFTALGNQNWTHSLAEPIAAMPLQIFAYAISPYDDWHRQAWAGALVLLLLVLSINIMVRFLTRDRFQPKI